MKKSIKKGFTLVELLVVIAIIAILSIVGIVGYVSFTNRARISNDTTIVTELNRVLQAEHVNKKPSTMQDVVDEIFDAGFDLTKLTPTAAKHDIVYDSRPEVDRFYLLNEEGKVVGGDKDKQSLDTPAQNLWKVVQKYSDATDGKYSYYLGKMKDGESEPGDGLTVKSGIDVGSNSVSKINYVGKGSTAQEVVIRTNGGTLTVNAPSDTIKHYGSAKVVTLTAVSSSSYYEHGVANLVDIKNGRLVITNDKEAEVGTIYLTATNNGYNGIILATQNGSELPDIVARESVDLPTGEAKKLVVTIQTNVNLEGQNPTKTEEIYLYSASDVKEGTNGYNVSDLGLLVVEAITPDAQTQAAEQITNAEILEAVKEAKTSELEAVAEKATLFAGGKGTAEKPYLISNVNELEAFRDAWNNNKLEKGIYFALSADIDMAGRAWTPIGNDSAHAFSGYFDGRKHKISNLTSTNYTGPELVLSSSGTSGSGLGLFGWGIGNIEVKDLDLEVRFNEQSSYVGGVLGVYIRSNSDEETFSVKFKNITVDGSMVAKDKMGAIVGSTYASSYSGTNKTITIEFNNCTNNATICGIDSSARIGGIAGTVSAQFAGDRANGGSALNNEEKVLFIDCVNTSEAITSTSSTYKVGGIVGFLASPGNYEFNNCSSVEVANGGKLFGRYHFAGSESTYNPTGNPATGIGLENGFGYLDFTPIRYTQWDAYQNTSKDITIYWQWLFAEPDNYHGNTATYSIGTALASNQWRLTIDNNHYRCAYNTPINSVSDCTLDTPHSVETRLPAGHWSNNQYGMKVNEAGTYYTFTKESPNQ